MAVAYVQTHTSGTSNASGTTVAATVATADVAAGNLLLLWVGFDNTGAATPIVSSISVPSGETAAWAKVVSHDSASAGSALGCRGELWAIVTTQAWAVAQAVTVTLSAAVTAKVALLKEFSGASVTVRGTAGSGETTTIPPSVSTSGTALVAGDLVIGAAAVESASATLTPDSDTLNGSWASTAQGNVGTGSAGISVITQHKIITATGVQTYNPTSSASTDSGTVIVALTPTAPTSFSGWGIPL